MIKTEIMPALILKIQFHKLTDALFHKEAYFDCRIMYNF